MERKTLTKVVAGNVLLCSLALGIGCDCLCRSRPTTVGTAPSRAPGQASDGRPGESWRFVVSGDSRNCGDVVMPAIAAGAKLDGASFYWHLGDLRAIYDFDQDMVQAATLKGQHLNIISYENDAWDDFKRYQIAPFDNIPMPFYLGIGNHETIPPKTRCEFVQTFAASLDKPELQDGKSRAAQGPQSTGKTAAATKSPTKSKTGTGEEKQSDAVNACAKQCAECAQLETRTYYHWSKAGVDFIYLDNASKEQFDQPQMDWLDSVLKKDMDDKSITTVVVGMHKALPWSVTCDHSMNESKDGTRTGEEVYRKLVALEKKRKVYVLASHSHYFMKDIFNTSHWRNDGVLPGWIIGTAGAERYPLPPPADLANSKTYTYGYLLARVFSDGTIDFAFTELTQSNIPTEIKSRYTDRWISEACFDGNRKTDKTDEPEYCKESAAQKQ